MSFDSGFGNFSVPTEQQPQHGYTGLDTYYSHESTNYASASLVLGNDGRPLRSTPGMTSSHPYVGNRPSLSYSDQQLPLSVNTDQTMTIVNHELYNSAFMSSNAAISLTSPNGCIEEHPNVMCDSHNAKRQRLHEMMSDVNGVDSMYYQQDLSSSIASEGADLFQSRYEGNTIGAFPGGVGHMVTGIGGGVDNGGGGYSDSEFTQIMEQICSPEATSDPLLPQCSPVMVYNDDSNDLLRRVQVEETHGGAPFIKDLDLEAFQATDVHFQQSATICGDFLKAPIQPATTPTKSPCPSEPCSQTVNSMETEPQSIEHDLEIMSLMRTKKKKSIPPQTLVLQSETTETMSREAPREEENLAVTICTPANVKTDFNSSCTATQAPDFPPQTPLGVGFGQPPMTPVQATSTPATPATPCPSFQKGPYDLSTSFRGGKRCLSLSVRKDIPDQGKRMAFQANHFSYQLCGKYQDCLKREFDLNMALNRRAEMCEFDIQYETGQMNFAMPRECMHLDKWLAAHQNDIDLLTRQLVVQQVANFLAAIHGCGSEDKLCLWGSFVVWVDQDRQVHILVDFPEMLSKMERQQMNPVYDPRVEDVKALYDLYMKVFEPFIKRGTSWVSPGVNHLLRSFEKLLSDPTSVYRVAELARMFGERRLCKLEVEIMSIGHSTYCIEHEKLDEVLAHFREMLPASCARWQVQWAESRTPVMCGVVAVAQRCMKVRFVPMESSEGSRQ